MIDIWQWDVYDELCAEAAKLKRERGPRWWLKKEAA